MFCCYLPTLVDRLRKVATEAPAVGRKRRELRERQYQQRLQAHEIQKLN